MKKNIKYYTEKPPFINRIEEKKYFLDYFNWAPTNILFVYWPKSTWKTTLINKIIKEDLNNNKFNVNFLNLRSVLLTNFIDFKHIFFPEHLKSKTKQILEWAKLSAFWFSWEPKDLDLIETNIFTVLENKIRELNSKWIKPVIIIDEFQYLKDIFIDKERGIKLINELFKFFISLTKQFNLCHIVCLTSDSYFLEELYNDTKLANTSDFYLMEHLSKKDIFYWLEDLEKIDKKIVEKIWRKLGGSVWEIWQVLISYKNTWNYENKLDDLLKTKYSLVLDWYRRQINNPEKKSDFVKIIKNISKKWYYKYWIEENYYELIKELVDKDIWFYDIKDDKITANSKSLEVVFKKLLKEIDKQK